MFYAVQATVTERTRDGSITRQIPTFYLNERVQGIMSERHAASIVRDILNPHGDSRLSVSPNVCKLPADWPGSAE